MLYWCVQRLPPHFPFHLRAGLMSLSRLPQRGWGKAHGLYGVQNAHRELPAH